MAIVCWASVPSEAAPSCCDGRLLDPVTEQTRKWETVLI